MQVARVQTADEMSLLIADWNCLTRGVPFRGPAWLVSWWNHFGRDRELFMLSVRDASGTLVGLAPWLLDHSASQGRTLRFLGSGTVCSDYLSVLTTEGYEDEVVAALGHWLSGAGRANGTPADRWDLLELDGVASTDRTVAKLVEQLVEHGCSVHRRGSLNCWRIELPASWDDYLASISKSHRKQIRRVESRVLEAGRAQLRTTTTRNGLSEAMAKLVDLHQRRRASLGQAGCFSDRVFSRFLHQSAEWLADCGQLELQILDLDQQPAAAEFHLVGGGAVYAYQAGLDPDRLDDEPGRIMNVAVLKRAIEQRRHAFDFLRGDEPYKAHWRAQPQPLVQLRVVPPHAAARLRHGMWLAGDTVKHFVRSSLNLSGMH